jgi:putative transposase
MLILEYKIKAHQSQYQAIDEAIRTAQFIRNKCLRHWMDTKAVGRYDFNNLCADLAKEFPFAHQLNSMARQAAAERAWQSVARFYANCNPPSVPPLKGGMTGGAKGYPKFKKNCRSVEYKTSGWKLSDDRKRITFSDGCGIGILKLVGTRDLNFFSRDKIKRVRLVKRADGYYCQLSIDTNRRVSHEFQNKISGIDMNLENFLTDSHGEVVENPRFLRKSEKQLKGRQRQVSRKKKGSNNRKKAVNKLARKHLKIQRQRKDFAIKTARTLVQSNDLIVYEDLRVKNMVKNHCLAKSISDAAWSLFTNWLKYFGKLYGVPVVAVPPHYTSQECSECHVMVKKSLSTRTHRCKCGLVLGRDHNAAINILAKGLRLLSTAGHAGINACGDDSHYSSLIRQVEQAASAKQESPRL